MFTVLSKTRNSNLYLMAAFAVAVLVLTSFAVAPAVSAPKPAAMPVTSNSDTSSDYFLRHPELRISAAPAAVMNSDFYQRHPDWGSAANIAPVTGSVELSDYFLRHPELNAPATLTIDMMRYRTRNQNSSSQTTDLSDYFQRH